MANIISQTKWARSPEYRDLPEHEQRKLYEAYVASTIASSISPDSQITDDVAYRYREFLKNILIYVTQEDTEIQRFVKNLDFNKKEDVAIAIPFYVRRLKEIALYYVDKRKEIGFAKHRINKNGSTEGFKRFTKRFLLTLVSDQSFKSRHPKGSIPDFDLILKNAAINVEQLYDLNTDYHDNIDDDIEGLLYFDTDFKASVQKLFKKYPLQLKTKSGVTIRTSRDTIIRINVPRNDYTKLPLRHFFRGDVALENLEFNFKKQKYETYAGSNHHYLRSDGTSGKLFTAKSPHKNLTNQKYPTVAKTNKSKKLKKINEIGGWFLPSKFGTLSLLSKGAKYKFKTKGLAANTILTFPDPSKFGDIKRTGKITFTENHAWVKAGRGNNYIVGDIYDASGLYSQKLWPYQSKEETLKFNFQGISRAEDPVDFWVGDNKTIWGNEDVYPKLALRPYDIDGKQNDLVVTDKTSYAWFADSFGNEFALYKETIPTKQHSRQKDGVYKHSPGNRMYYNETDAFNPNYVRDYDKDLFQSPKIKIFQHTYSTAFTEYETETNSLTADKSLFDKQNLYGKLHFRNAFSSVIAPLEEMYDKLFIKYINDPIIWDELKNKVKDFDVFGDIIVVRTENYLIVEKYFLDSETGYVKAGPTPKIMFKITYPEYEKIGKPWFYEDGNELFVVQTKLHPYVKDSNFKLIYPEITIVNLDNLNITKAFPNTDNIKGDINTQPFETYNEFAEKNISMMGADTSINFVKIGVPQITFNKGTGTYAITYTAFDEFNYTYLFSIWMKKRESTFFIARSTLLTPDKTVASVDFANFRELEKQIKQFVSVASYSTSQLTTQTVLPSNIDIHGYMPDTQSILVAGGVLDGDEVIRTTNNSINSFYGSESDRTTIMTVNTGVQGGEKVTMLAETGFYHSTRAGVINPLSGHGATMFFYGAYDDKVLDYSNNIIDTQAIPETGYVFRDIISDDFQNVRTEHHYDKTNWNKHITSSVGWGNYPSGSKDLKWGSNPPPNNYRRIVLDADDNYCLELQSGKYRNGGGVYGVTYIGPPEKLKPGTRYRISFKAKVIKGTMQDGVLTTYFQIHNQSGNGDGNNLSHNFKIVGTEWKTYTHEVMLNIHKSTMYMWMGGPEQGIRLDDFKLQEMTPNSSFVVTDNMPDWGNTELFNNTNGFSCIKDKLIGFGLDFSGTKTVIFDDFEQAHYTNWYSGKPDGTSVWRSTLPHSSGNIDSGMKWNQYRSGYLKNYTWGRVQDDTGSGVFIVNDDSNPDNQLLSVSTGEFRNGGSATGGAYLPNMSGKLFEVGKKYKITMKARISGGARYGAINDTWKSGGEDTAIVNLAQWSGGTSYIGFPITREWQTITRTFTVHPYHDGDRPYIQLEGFANATEDAIYTKYYNPDLHPSPGYNYGEGEIGHNGRAWGNWYLAAWGPNGSYLTNTTYQIDNFKIEEVVDNSETPYRVFNSQGATIATGSIPSVCPSVSARGDIVFNKYKLDLEIEANKLTVYTKSPTDTKYIQRAEVDITGALNKYPPMIAAGISTVSHVNTRTNCEIKKLSLTGGKSKPETTIYVSTERVKQE